MQWYKSTYTNKIIARTAAKVTNNIFGVGTFDSYVEDGVLVPVDNPSVIDVLRDTRSKKLAVIRYQELHKCSAAEAEKGVAILKRDMALPKKWKNKRNGG